MNSQKIKSLELLKLLASSKPSMSKDYYCWKKLNANDFKSFTLIGELEVENCIDTEYKTSESYWSENYPIALEYFPNSGSDIYFDSENYYLVYQDFGGHVPEKRCRLLRSDIIIIK